MQDCDLSTVAYFNLGIQGWDERMKGQCWAHPSSLTDLALDGAYHLLRAALVSNPTRRTTRLGARQSACHPPWNSFTGDLDWCWTRTEPSQTPQIWKMSWNCALHIYKMVEIDMWHVIEIFEHTKKCRGEDLLMSKCCTKLKESMWKLFQAWSCTL